jgi:hypothetical protein
LDGNRLTNNSHFNAPTPESEARALLLRVVDGRASIDETRLLIAISATEEIELQKLLGRGVTARAVRYRREVLECFENLLAAESQ